MFIICFGFLFYFYLCVCVWGGVCTHTSYHRPEECVGSPGVGVMDICESSNLGAGIPAGASSKGNKYA